MNLKESFWWVLNHISMHGYFGEIVKLMCAQRAESVHTEQQACPATTGFRVYKSEMESNTHTSGNSHF